MSATEEMMKKENKKNFNSELLLTAISRGMLELTREILKDPLNLEYTDEYNNTALIFASRNGWLDVVDTLLNLGVSVNAQSANGATPLLVACEYNQESIVNRLLLANADRCIAKNTGITPLGLACYKGQTSIVKMLLSAEKTMVEQMMSATFNECGSSPLIIACLGNNPEIVKLLLEAGANPVYARKDKRNALHVASEKNIQPIIDLLLNNEKILQHINDVTDLGFTALASASERGFVDLVEKLLNKNADVNVGIGVKPIHAACQFESDETALKLVVLLVKAGANTAALTDKNASALYFACQEGHRSVVQYLLHTDALKVLSVCVTENGHTPHSIALINGHVGIASYIDPRRKFINQQFKTLEKEYGEIKITEERLTFAFYPELPPKTVSKLSTYKPGAPLHDTNNKCYPTRMYTTTLHISPRSTPSRTSIGSLVVAMTNVTSTSPGTLRVGVRIKYDTIITLAKIYKPEGYDFCLNTIGFTQDERNRLLSFVTYGVFKPENISPSQEGQFVRFNCTENDNWVENHSAHIMMACLENPILESKVLSESSNVEQKLRAEENQVESALSKLSVANPQEHFHPAICARIDEIEKAFSMLPPTPNANEGSSRERAEQFTFLLTGARQSLNPRSRYLMVPNDYDSDSEATPVPLSAAVEAVREEGASVRFVIPQ